MRRFDGRVVIITGSSSGIGQHAAVEFGKEGAIVVIHGQSAERLRTEELLHEAGIPSDRILQVLGSLEDEDTPKKIVDAAVAKYGKIDVLINNAGAIAKPDGEDADSMQNFDFLIKVNLRSAVALTHLAIPYLQETRGNVINVSSAGAVKVVPTATYYCMTKAALDHFTRNMAQKLGEKGIRVNSLNPGPIESNIFDRFNPPDAVKKAHQKWIRDTTALHREGKQSEISSILKFLASDEASYVTGACWFADGGHTFHTPEVSFLDE
ncbi:short-chain dehydrogenease/reductase-like protein [Aphelenchoides avenae]|nr:short-chain dehydrogenease/reductase-like protein [Aphelenchus avenae]